MSSLADVLAIVWPAIPTVAPIAFGAGFLYLRTQFPTKADFDSLVNTVNSMGEKLTANSIAVDHLAKEQDSAPSRVEILQKIGQLEGRVSGFEGVLDGMQHQLSTANDYLKILVDRGLDR